MNFIQKLNNIDIKELQKIDPNEVKAYLLQNFDISICLILGILTLFISFKSFSSYKDESVVINKKISTLKAANTALEKDKKVMVQYDKFLSSFPETISINDLTEKLTAYASENNVHISTYSPGKAKTTNKIEVNSITIDTSAKNYDDMVAFVKQIENSEYAIRVASWSGRQGQLAANPDSLSQHNDSLNNETISAQILVETVQIKDE